MTLTPEDIRIRSALAKAGMVGIERLIALATQDKDLNIALQACTLLTRSIIPPAQQAALAPSQHLHAYLPPLFAGQMPAGLLAPMESDNADDSGGTEAGGEGRLRGPETDVLSGGSQAANAGSPRPDGRAVKRHSAKAKKLKPKASAADKGNTRDGAAKLRRPVKVSGSSAKKP